MGSTLLPSTDDDQRDDFGCLRKENENSVVYLSMMLYVTRVNLKKQD